jgi:serine/threonine-protein kinase
VAVVLWEALTGERLFRGENEGHTVERVLFGALSPPSALRSDVPPALDAVVMRGLSRERTARFGTAKEMALALSAAVLPASTPEVGEWVEGRAIDALEHRAKLVEEVEATDVATYPATEATASAVSLPARARRTRVAIASAVLVAAGLGGGLGVRAYDMGSEATASASPSPPAAASSPPIAGAPPQVATPSVATTPLPETTSPAPISSAVAETKTPRPITTPPLSARSVKHVTKGGAAPPKAACQRRGADGEIEFDMECLRAAQGRP